MDWFDFLLPQETCIALGRLLLASLLGGLIGLEREIHGRPAGFRTHLLVTVGACLMMLVSEFFYFKYAALGADSAVRLDPGRVAAQIVTGIGFLGAGAIIKEGQMVRGLTTAACLWVVAGIGMAVGAGLYIPALLVTAIALFNLLFLKRLEKLLKKDRYRTLIIHCEEKGGMRQILETFLAGRRLQIIDFGVEKDVVARSVRFEFVITHCGDEDGGELAEAVVALAGVQKVRLR